MEYRDQAPQLPREQNSLQRFLLCSSPTTWRLLQWCACAQARGAVFPTSCAVAHWGLWAAQTRSTGA